MFPKINFIVKIQETNTRYETPNKLNIDQRESTLFPTRSVESFEESDANFSKLKLTMFKSIDKVLTKRTATAESKVTEIESGRSRERASGESERDPDPGHSSFLGATERDLFGKRVLG